MGVKKRGELSNGPPDEPLSGGDYEPRPAGLDRATELKLLDAALLNDMQAFSELFEHYRAALYGLCCRRLNDFALAEDVVQEVFLKAFKNLPNSDYRKPIWPWLAAIAHRMCIDVQRRRSLIHYSGDIRLTMDEDAETNGHTESALDSVIASEDRVELWKSLEVLPPRQRRAFVLYEVDGLSCADIAAAEGISVAAVYRLLFRARKKMRSVGQSGPLPAITFPLWLRWKFQQMQERVRPLLGVYGEGFSTACMQAACLGTVAMMVVAANSPLESFRGDDAISPNGTIVFTKATGALPAVLQNSTSNIGGSKTPVEAPQSVVASSSSLVDQIINPGESATPENAHLTSIVASPNYESDHTILASGVYSPADVGKRSILFVSRDGGANWKPLPSRLLLGHTVIIPPGYPEDQRIFSLGESSLQQSDDGGEGFRTVSTKVSPLARGVAISPLFDRGDSRILISDKVLLEYDADTGITRPALLAIPPPWDEWPSIAFSPGYRSDPTVFLSDPGYGGSTLHRCQGSVCDKTRFPFSGLLRLKISPRFDQDALAYAFTPWKVLVSNDGARTLQDLKFPLPDSGAIRALAVLWNTSSDSVLFASVVYAPRSIYRSLDAGRSWNRTSSIDLPSFHYGAENLIVTPTGRILATAMAPFPGIACSEDGGQTWALRCTPEP